jgi:VanZ family protein
MVVLLAGVGLMIEGSWSWGQLWVLFALVSFAGSFVLGLGLIGPLAKKLPAVGPTTQEGQALTRRIFALIRIDLLFLFGILFAMSVKPTGDDGWTVAVAAVVVAALTAFFVRQATATPPGRPAPAAGQT